MLFVSNTTGGGSGRSQRELARRLTDLGHEILILVDGGEYARVRDFFYENLADAAVRFHDRRFVGLVRTLERLPGRRTRDLVRDGIEHRLTPVPENAFHRTLDEFRPDVVVGNSILRLAWRKVRPECVARGIPTVLYIRETNLLDHLLPGELPDLVVANARMLAAAVEARGVPCPFVPSVIDVSPTRTTSTRQVALVINPISTHGLDFSWRLAEAVPEIPIVLQESWLQRDKEWAALERTAARHPNVEVRRRILPGPELYGDARVLLVPHLVDNRPRVVHEAQVNGIPVLAAAVPGLVEAVGEGGSTVSTDDLDGWVTELRSMWFDTTRYDDLSERALEHSRRAELDPEAVAARFDELVRQVVRPSC